MVNTLEKCVYFLLSRQAVSNLYDLEALLNCSPSILLEAQTSAEFGKFFNKEYEKPSNGTRLAILTRVQRLLNNPLLRPLIGGDDTIDLEDALNTGKQIIVNLGSLPEMARKVFGKFLIAQMKALIWKRESLPESQRWVVINYMDEFQNLLSQGVEQFLAEFRKYRFHSILAHQHTDQLSGMRHSVMANTNIKAVGKLNDSETISVMAKILGIPDESLKNIERYYFWIKYGNKKAFLVKAPSTLYTDKTKLLSGDKLKKLEDYVVEKYYKRVDDSRTTHKDLPPLPEPG